MTDIDMDILLPDNIELFDMYLDGRLSKTEEDDFLKRLKSDPEFASDFRIYSFALNGLLKEHEEENMEFGIAMKHLDESKLDRAIDSGSESYRARRVLKLTTWLTAAACLLVVLTIGLTSWIVNSRATSAADARIDDLIVAYNYIPLSDRGSDEAADESIPALEKAYRSAPADDIQLQEETGLRLAMAYLRQHDRPRAEQLLADLEHRFATSDPDFAARCRLILTQLNP